MSASDTTEGTGGPPVEPPHPLVRVAVELTHDPAFAKLEPRGGSHATELAQDLVAAIAARLRAVAPDLDDAQFSALVLDVARTKVRFARLDREVTGWIAPPNRTAGH